MTIFKQKIQKFREYLDYVDRHYDNVQKAWALINEKCENKGYTWIYDDSIWFAMDDDVKNHDLSKLSEYEFTQYRNYFFPIEGEEKDKDKFLMAWEHHKNHNTHHWQTWTTRYADNRGAAEACLIMMIVDWVAMGFEFGNTAKEYYEKNKADIKLPKWAEKIMYEVFDCIYP